MWSYSNNWHSTVTSPPVVLGYNPFIAFALWYNVATYGSDGIYIEVLHNGDVDTLDFLGSGGALDSLTPIVNSWAIYRYELSSFNAGDTVQIAFEFVSDDQDTAEGFYLDHFTISGYSLYSLGVNDGVSRNNFEILYIPGGFEIIPFDDYIVAIYDVTGRKILDRFVNSGRVYRVRGLRSGVYFVRVGGEVKRIAVVR